MNTRNIGPSQDVARGPPGTFAWALSGFLFEAGGPDQVRVRPDIRLVHARRRELGDDGALGPRLEPMEGIGGDRGLIPRFQDDLLPDREMVSVLVGDVGPDPPCGFPFRVKIDFAPAAAEGFFFPGIRSAERRVPVLGAYLPWEEDDLLGAAFSMPRTWRKPRTQRALPEKTIRRQFPRPGSGRTQAAPCSRSGA